MGKNTATPQDSARAMRRALKAAFPGIRFGVTMSRGTAWGNYSVAWTDGPSEAAVEAVTDPFEGKGFDGMTDSTYYLDKPLGVDVNGEPVLSGIGMILRHRSVSAESMSAARSILTLAGYAGGELDMNCAGRMVANGTCPHEAAQHHHLQKGEA